MAIVLGLSISPPAVGVRSVACAQKGIGRAHVCALKDFGKPLPSNPRATDEPTWFTDVGAMAVGTDSNLYSTSPSGGVRGAGTAFRMTPAGALKLLQTFDNRSGVGGGPRSGLTNGGDGWFYGTTYGGGAFKIGTIFRVNAMGDAKVLYSFRNGIMTGLIPPCENRRCPFSPKQRADAAGSYPTTPPVPDGKGNFYGVTGYAFNQKYGVFYRLSPPYDSTGFSTLCIFAPSLVRDIALAGYLCHPKITYPRNLTMQRGSATLYGTTAGGSGTVFSATLDGKVTVLHEFTPLEGSNPTGLIQASDGRLYGTAYAGGPANLGSVFRLNPATGDFSVLTGFKPLYGVAGYNPLGGVTEGWVLGKSDGYVYGTTRYGGQYGRGIIYRVGMDGTGYSVLHDFYTTGWNPMTAPVQGNDGAFYGVTYRGGTWLGGTFYRLTHPEYPVRQTSPSAIAPTIRSTLVKDDLIQVQTSVVASQTGEITGLNNDGISVKMACRDPHFVQFIYREKISALGYYFPDSMFPSSGAYTLTTDPLHPIWHSDAASKPNGYTDEGDKTAYRIALAGGVTELTIWDQPTFDGPDTTIFRPSQQDPITGETWRATVKVFAMCNCHVMREINWTTEKKGGKRSYKDISIKPADDSALDWINKQLVKDGFDPVP